MNIIEQLELLVVLIESYQSRGLYSEADSDPATDWISVLLGDIQISHELIDEILELNEGPEPQAVSQTQVASASDAANFIHSISISNELEKDEVQKN